MRKLHDIHFPCNVPQCLIRLLLAVTGRFTDNKIGRLHIGTKTGELESHKGLDQGAGIARYVLFRFIEADLRARAESDADAVDRQNEFLGNIYAEGSDDRPALLFRSNDLFNTESVYFRNHKVEIAHALGPVALGKVHPLVGIRQHRQQSVVRLQIDPEFLPHCTVIFCHEILLVWCNRTGTESVC